MGRDNPLRQIPKLYGKLQGKNPARWLTHDEAFNRLVRACQDETDLGLRDEALLRLGLAGMRAAEIIHLTAGDLRLDQQPPLIVWIGKKRQPRQVVPGPSLVTALLRLRTATEAAVGHPAIPTDPVLSRGKPGAGAGQVSWGSPILRTCSVQRIVTQRADQAGLGHVSPHDLRRTAAGILHRTTAQDGGHRFDLLDIQKVLGHKDPATTMRSYLDPLDNGVLSRAAAVLD
jgi:integrase